MKINELLHSPKNTPESNLVTALELIRQRYKDKNQSPKISTQSLINMVLNTDRTFDYEALQHANDTNPAVKNLIKKVDKDTVELRSADEADDESDFNVKDTTDAPVDTVSNMAKSAARKRNAPGF